jgi:CHAT domain-containing protein
VSEDAAGATPLATKDESPADGRTPWFQAGDISAGRDVNFGLAPEQVKELTEAAARGATGPLTSAIVDLSKRLGITEDATKTLLRIVGEQDVPLERLSETLNRVANDYKRLRRQAAALNPDNPTAKALVEQAKPEIEAGHLGRARDLLREATQVQIAAAQQAYQIQDQARAAGDTQMLGAAQSTAAEADVAMTERRYLEAQELFGQAANYVPSGHASERDHYLTRGVEAQRVAFIELFRVKGTIDSASLARMAKRLEPLVQNATGETRAKALVELGTVFRMSNDYQRAIKTHTEAAREAEALGLKDLAFDAWIGVARANEYGPADHGAAAVAFDRAVDMAGELPSVKQLADLAGYLAQLEIGRGELEAGIIDALMAIRLTNDPKDRFYSEIDLADALQKLAESCDYRPLVDAKSSEDKDDVYGACRRAVAAAQAAYQQAGSTAAGLGWSHLVDEVHGFESRLEIRGKLIDMRASAAKMSLGNVFHPRSSRDVLANQNFQAGATPALASLIESVVKEAEAKTRIRNVQSGYLIGLVKDLGNVRPEAAAQYYADAARMLAAERSGFFDPRRRGTVIENRSEIIRDLAIRLLALGREAYAFAAFESVSARGLVEFALAMARPDVSADDRRWLAELLVIEAQASAIEHKIVAEIVASGQLDAHADNLRTLEELRAERQAKLKANETARARFDLRNATASVTLDALRAATAGTGVPVLLYWTTYANVIAWYVGPGGSDVRSVFLPASVLEEKVRNVLRSSGDSFGRRPFDETTARELFLYLIAPFAPHLELASEVMIVPQGSLIGLPFEALIDPASGASVIDRWAVSYAPNATMALAALQRKAGPLRTVVALIDPALDLLTNETQAIQATGVELKTLTRDELFAGAWQGDGLHILTHGDFDPDEGLLSRLAPTRSIDRPILAAELVSLPLRGLRLAVLSAANGALTSAGVYGFSWALLAGGASAAVSSRWEINDEINGRWMRVFYREVAGGVPVAMAAAVATREIRESGITHPFYWAAMQVSGR